MTDSLDIEIRQQLAKYLGDEQSLSQFVGWFAPRSWNIHKADDAHLADLVYTIDLLLSEYTDGGWTEEQLRSQLSPLVREYSTVLAFGTSEVISMTSGARTYDGGSITLGQVSPSKTVGKELEWELV